MALTHESLTEVDRALARRKHARVQFLLAFGLFGPAAAALLIGSSMMIPLLVVFSALGIMRTHATYRQLQASERALEAALTVGQLPPARILD